MRYLVLMLGFLPILINAKSVQESTSVKFFKNKCATEENSQLRKKYCDLVVKQKRAEAILDIKK